MILGCYYLTISKEKNDYISPNFSREIRNKHNSKEGIKNWYATFNEALEEYYNNRVALHTPIWVIWNGKSQNLISEQTAQERNTPLELRFTNYGQTEFIFGDQYLIESKPPLLLNKSKVDSTTNNPSQRFIRTTPGRLILYKLINLSMLGKANSPQA
jgi:hypothetical protein